MPNSCTIYSPIVDFSVIGVVAACLQGWHLELDGPKEHWTKARFSSGDDSLELNSLEFMGPGDPFSKITFGTSNFVRRNNTLPEAEKKELVRFVVAVNWLIGVVSSGELESNDLRWKAVNAATRQLQGRIFTGTALVSPA